MSPRSDIKLQFMLILDIFHWTTEEFSEKRCTEKHPSDLPSRELLVGVSSVGTKSNSIKSAKKVE